jgi:hypothetical protein
MTQFDNTNIIFKTAVSFINQTSKHLFLTGKAGTGKTTFLKYIKETSYKKMAIVAPTGVAAINAGGVTIHSFFQLPPGTYLPTQQSLASAYDGKVNNQHTLFRNMRMSASRREILRELELLIIDEVSMVRADLLDAMDAVLRHFRRQPLLPFGGVQVLYIGDLFQLPPVVRNDEWGMLKEFYESPFFFDSLAVKAAPPVYIELQKIYRQSDNTFIHILNNIRNNQCTPQDLEQLHLHYQPQFTPAKKDNFITLTTHNDKADAINRAELQKLPGRIHEFKAEVSGEFSDRSFPADETLSLKVGAQIMFLKNDVGDHRKFYNGKIGTIKSISDDKVIVSFPNETDKLELKKELWQNIRYHYAQESDKIEEEELGTFKQYPIRLAWAITIHKSQGLTFDKAIIDAGSSFAAGQVYVALSRLTGLEGMVLKSKIYPHCIHTDERVLRFLEANEPNEEELQQMLKAEQEQFIRNSLIQSFSWAKVWEAIKLHVESYERRQVPDADTAVAWANGLLNIVQDLQEVALRFQKQLIRLFEEGVTDSYEQLHKRTATACNWFIKEADEKLLSSIDNHIEAVKQKGRVKKYMKELQSLRIVLDRKKLQYQNVLNIATALHQSKSGAEILEAVEALHKPLPVEAPAQQQEQHSKKKEKGETHRLSLQMYKEGKSIADIAQERNLAPTTIEGHLASFIPTGEIDVLELVDQSKLDKILKVLEQESEPVFATSVKNKLGNDFSFSEVRAAMKYWEKEKESSK